MNPSFKTPSSARETRRELRVGVAIALLLLSVFGPASAAEPRNLSLHKQELAKYVSSGSYARDVASVALSANKYLLKRIAGNAKPGGKLAIVFDIDETLLTNLGHMMANDYGYVPKVWTQWVSNGQAPAIIPVQTIYDTAVRAKIAVFIITGRTEDEKVPTERNLQQVGYETWTRIIYYPADPENPQSNSAFKTAARRKLTEEGFTIVANVGDQESDLAEGYAERTFKLPNPFYKYD